MLEHLLHRPSLPVQIAHALGHVLVTVFQGVGLLRKR
jgi:hypothetical protein